MDRSPKANHVVAQITNPTTKPRVEQFSFCLLTMVVYMLYFKAELENIGSVSLDVDKNICFSVRNPLSDYEVREKVVMNLTETLEQEESSREPAHHFRLKWEGSQKASILTVLDAAGAKAALKKKKGVTLPRSYTAEDSGEFVPLLAVEARGLEPYAFSVLGNEFRVTSEGGAVYEGDAVDLSEGDWAEYDEENDVPVSLSEIEFKWEGV